MFTRSCIELSCPVTAFFLYYKLNKTNQGFGQLFLTLSFLALQRTSKSANSLKFSVISIFLYIYALNSFY